MPLLINTRKTLNQISPKFLNDQKLTWSWGWLGISKPRAPLPSFMPGSARNFSKIIASLKVQQQQQAGSNQEKQKFLRFSRKWVGSMEKDSQSFWSAKQADNKVKPTFLWHRLLNYIIRNFESIEHQSKRPSKLFYQNTLPIDRRNHPNQSLPMQKRYIFQCSEFLIIFVMNFWQNVNKSKLRWSQEEQKLIEYLHSYEARPWKEISRIHGAKFPDKSRSAKQCRERYNNFIKFGKNQESSLSWGSAEDKKLLEAYLKMGGGKWVQISELFLKRSPNDLKNKFYGSIRRFLRKLNSLRKAQKSVDKKQITYCSLYRLLQTNVHEEFVYDQMLELQVSKERFIRDLKKQVLEQAADLQSFAKQKATQLGDKIKRFNILTRADRIKAIKVSKFKRPKQVEKAKIDDISNINERQGTESQLRIQEWSQTRERADDQQSTPEDGILSLETSAPALISWQKIEQYQQEKIRISEEKSVMNLAIDIQMAEIFHPELGKSILNFLDQI